MGSAFASPPYPPPHVAKRRGEGVNIVWGGRPALEKSSAMQGSFGLFEVQPGKFHRVFQEDEGGSISTAALIQTSLMELPFEGHHPLTGRGSEDRSSLCGADPERIVSDAFPPGLDYCAGGEPHFFQFMP